MCKSASGLRLSVSKCCEYMYDHTLTYPGKPTHQAAATVQSPLSLDLGLAHFLLATCIIFWIVFSSPGGIGVGSNGMPLSSRLYILHAWDVCSDHRVILTAPKCQPLVYWLQWATAHAVTTRILYWLHQARTIISINIIRYVL